MASRDILFGKVLAVLACVGIAVLCAASFRLGVNWAKGNIEPQKDTIFLDKPVVKEVVPKGCEVVPIGTIARLNGQIAVLQDKVGELQDTLERKPKVIVRDSLVYVEIPMEQKHYGSPVYDAWVSGYKPTLDSIKFYPPTPKKRRWGVGVSAGYGMGKDGLTPYVGAGVTYNLLSW